MRNDSLRQFVAQTLQSHTGFDVTGIYESPEVFLAEPKVGIAPRVVLLDNSLLGTGLQRLRQLKQRIPSAEIILFTLTDRSDDIYNAFRAGVSGYILQSEAPEDMVNSIHKILSGDIILLPSIAQKILDNHLISHNFRLTPEEESLMRAVGDGHATGCIRNALMISGETMRVQIKSIFNKLHSSTQPATTSN